MTANTRLPQKLIIILLLPAIFLFVFLQAGNAEAKLYGLDASWLFTEQGSDKQDDNNSSFLQRYHLQWSPKITRAISMDADMNYSRSYWDAGNATRTRENISPTLDMDLRNDLFIAGFNGSIYKTRNSDSRDLSEYNWETILQSNWQNLYWPSLRMLLGQSQQSEDGTGRGVINDRDWYELSGQWEVDALQTYYSYYSSNRTDYLDDSVYEDDKHFGRADYSRSFLDSRGVFSISEQITHSVTDFSAAVREGENINIGVGLSQAFAGNDQTPDQGGLPANPGLMDGNRNTPVFVVQLLQKANLGVKADLQRVDTLYVYTGELDPLLVNETGNLRWDLYTSRDGSSWRRERINVPTVYNRNDFRYEVDVRGTENIYLKLVVTAWPVSLSVPVTEIEAYRTRTGTGKQLDETRTYTKYLTDFNVSYAPVAMTQATYSMVWKTEDNSQGNNRDRLFQTGSLRWLYSKYFTPSLTINDTKETNTEIKDTHQRSYGLNIRSMPLPTLDTTLSFTSNERDEDGETVSKTFAVDLRTLAILYPNLESTLDLNLIFNDNQFVDQTSKAYGVRWILSSRLRPSLIASLTTEYRANTVDYIDITSEEVSSGSTTLNLNYRVSDRLSFQLNGTQGFGDRAGDEQSLTFKADFSLLRTAKTEIFLGYRLTANQDESINNFDCNWSWNISPYLTFQSFANYLVTDEENKWAVNARLTAGF